MITPDLFLLQACKLIDPTNNPKEQDLRTAISRAYYSLYHETGLFLKKKHRSKVIVKIKEEFKKRNIEKYDRTRLQLIDKSYLAGFAINFHGIYSSVLSQVNWDLGQNFDGSRTDRNNADYDLKLNFKPEEAKDMIDDIQGTINSIKKL